MIKVRVKNNFLNERKGEPSVNASKVGVFQPNQILEVKDIINGDLIDQNSLWFELTDGSFVWSGGVEGLKAGVIRRARHNDIEISTTTPFSVENFWWLGDYRIGELWALGLTGSGVKICVLDTGIGQHPDLNIPSNQTIDVANSTPSTFSDPFGHGSHVTGIISARNNGFGTTGIAYNSSIYFCKIFHDFDGGKFEHLIAGIKWAIKKKVDILSISQAFDQTSESLESIIEEAHKMGIAIVAAAGNKTDPSDSSILYPAALEKVLSVGGVTVDKKPLDNTINAKTTQLFAPGENILSTIPKSPFFGAMTGSSMATSFVSSVLALLLQKTRKNNESIRANSLIPKLITTAEQVDGIRIVNPKIAIKSL